MCGIAGILDQKNNIDQYRLKQMTDVMIHRGPDAEGFYIKDGVGLGHRRLCIIDLDSGGQPVHNEDKSIWVIFNGEIYNYQQLRKDLIERGHKFYTNSDTETIVHLYEDYGDDCLKKLRGMFSLAIWDSRKKRLLLARDRVGKKPLSYYHRPGYFVFGSEIKSILCDPSIDRKISLSSIDQYLKFGYIAAPQSIYTEIKKLKPGHLLIYENDRIKTKPYWKFEFNEDHTLTEEEILNEIEYILLESTKLRMIADVPLGAFLSGGVDSSLVVALMSRLSDRPVKTFSIGFEEDNYSELEYARIVAKHLGTDHYEEILRPDFFDILKQLLNQFDEPFADSSMIPTYLVSKVSREHVTVALSGDGGDEIFAGYSRYLNLLRASKLGGIPGVRLTANLLGLMPGFSDPLKRKLKILASSGEKRQLIISSLIEENIRSRLYKNELNDYLRKLQPSGPEILYRDMPDCLNRWQYSDIHAYLPDDILVKVDRTSMLASLETRAPLLDHNVIEFMARVPEKLRIKNGEAKYLLKKIAEKYVPSEVLYRKKMGFAIPVDQWFRGPLKDMTREYLLSDDSKTGEFLRKDKISQLFAEHLIGRKDLSQSLYTLLYLELWLRQYEPILS